MASRKADKTLGSSQGHFSSEIGLLVLYSVHWDFFLPRLPPEHWNKLCTVRYNWGNTCENPQAYSNFYVKADSKALKTADSPIKGKIQFLSDVMSCQWMTEPPKKN